MKLLVEMYHELRVGRDLLGCGGMRRIEADDASGEVLCIRPAKTGVLGGVIQLARDEPVVPAVQDEDEPEIVVGPGVS
jgi:hypothetical protein